MYRPAVLYRGETVNHYPVPFGCGRPVRAGSGSTAYPSPGPADAMNGSP